MIFSGNLHYEEPIENTQGVLNYKSKDFKNKCIETGTFNQSFQLSGYGSRKVGNHHVIGKFIDGNIQNPLVLQKGVIYNAEMKIDDE